MRLWQRTSFVTAAMLLATPAHAGCKEAIDYSSAHRGVAVLVIVDGKRTCHSPLPTLAEGHEIFSGTKSVVGLAAAAAVQDGLLSLDEKLSDTFPDWRNDSQKKDATVRQLLAMTAGIKSQIGRPPGYAEAVAMPFAHAPGEVFQYGPAPMQIFGALLETKLSAAGKLESAQDYIKRRIFTPVGLDYVRWRSGPDGKALLPQGLVLQAPEWAKIGELVLNGGLADGAQILDPAAFGELFKGSAANPAYGLTWWVNGGPPNEDIVSSTVDIGRGPNALPRDLALSAGAGNQRLYVIPSRNMVIVRQARFEAVIGEARPTNGPAARWSDRRFLELLLTDE